MITFWIIGALLAAAALARVLWPLLRAKSNGLVSRRQANISIYKDQLRELEADLASGAVTRADYERSRVELEARMLEDVPPAEAAVSRPAGRRAALALGIAVPLLAVAVYLAIGNPRGLDARHAAGNVHEFQAMVDRLAAKMRENPDNVEGWKLLGRSYTTLGRFPQAVEAYAKAAERAPRDAQLLVDFADALAMTRGQSLAGEPERLVERALAIDPNNLKGLALSGTVAYERQDYAKAAEIWSRMLPLVPAGSEDARSIQQNVEEARKLAGIAGPPAAQAVPKDKPRQSVAAGHPGVRGTVRVSDELRKQVQPDDTVFVFALADKGPPMPLAALRAKARDLPLSFRLDDSMSMAQGLSVSAFPRVVVNARISRSGSVQAAAGDLQGVSQPVANDASGVTVVINSAVR
jgi:cytochrome c-type biogenesis protein CcmH